MAEATEQLQFELEPDDMYKSRAKEPTVAFAPLTREIGISPIAGEQYMPITPELESEVYSWVNHVRSPFDGVARAEGLARPESTYIASGIRGTINFDGSDAARDAKRGEIGARAIGRLHNHTMNHFMIAEDRTNSRKAFMSKLHTTEQYTDEEIGVAIESLQELANGFAANLDDLIEGGDERARLVGHGILVIAKRIEQYSTKPQLHKPLLSAAANYSSKQKVFWERKLKDISVFAESKKIKLVHPNSVK